MRISLAGSKSFNNKRGNMCPEFLGQKPNPPSASLLYGFHDKPNPRVEILSKARSYLGTQDERQENRIFVCWDYRSSIGEKVYSVEVEKLYGHREDVASTQYLEVG
jgi:hypothetical protein